MPSAKNSCSGSLRKRHPDPTVELHPDSASTRGIVSGDWVEIISPDGSMRARANLNSKIDPRIVVGQHGWWQACESLEAPSYDPFSATGSNYNMLIGTAALDPISGTASHKSYLCDVRAIN